MATLLSVNSYYYRRDGSEAVFFEHNRAYEQAGWNVVPFAMQHPDNFPTPWAEYFVTEVEFGRHYSFAEKVRRIPNVIYSFEARRNIGRLIDRVRPDLCHCHTVYHHLSPSIFGVLRRVGIPTVMTLHDLKIACPAYHMMNHGSVCERCKGGRLHNVLAHRCIKGSYSLSGVVMVEAMLHSLLRSYEDGIDVFISPSRFYIDKLVEWGWPRAGFEHIPNPVDVDQCRPSFPPGSAILYFGRLSPEKGLMTLIRAAAVAGVPVQIAGRGPQREELEGEAARLGAPVVFLGYLEGQALADAIAGCRATVLASEWYENAPMSLLESYAAGRPVIGAQIGGIPELIHDGVTGWLFKSGSVEELALRLRQVADANPSDVEAAGRAAHALICAEYSSARYQERMNALYSRLGVAA
jgi:glycosyltransferase involved in cell wall biosynthesis